VWTTTGVASAILICSTMVGQYGAWVMTSSPFWYKTIATL
jgi:hypothetical protein